MSDKVRVFRSRKHFGVRRSTWAMFFGWNRTVLPPKIDKCAALIVANGLRWNPETKWPTISQAAKNAVLAVEPYIKDATVTRLYVTGGHNESTLGGSMPYFVYLTETQSVMNFIRTRNWFDTIPVIAEEISKVTIGNFLEIRRKLEDTGDWQDESARRAMIVTHRWQMGRAIDNALDMGFRPYPLVSPDPFEPNAIVKFMRSWHMYFIRNLIASALHLGFHAFNRLRGRRYALPPF